MKPALLAHLACPSCHGDLAVRGGIGAEVVDGELECRGCAAVYPVRKGIPRFVDSGKYAASFGRQWNWFRSVQLDSQNGGDLSGRQLSETTGWSDEEYRGKLLLDAGVGAGRFAEVAARKGAEVIGVDLSDAVEAAHQNLRDHERVHIVQADIFALPFRPGTFDLAYSIGVLHHTPDTRGAFRRVAGMVKPGGRFAVYLYYRSAATWCADVLRRVTTRLPAPVALALCALAVPAYPLYRIPVLGKVLQFVLPISQQPGWKARWLDTFDWYTPTYQWKHSYPEVVRWFQENGFTGPLHFGEQAIRMSGIKGERLPAGEAVARNEAAGRAERSSA